jgi:hypothetical protein
MMSGFRRQAQGRQSARLADAALALSLLLHADSRKLAEPAGRSRDRRIQAGPHGTMGILRQTRFFNHQARASAGALVAIDSSVS